MKKTWKINFIDKARKEFRKLAQEIQEDILEFLKEKILSQSNPRIIGKPLLDNKKGVWRYRVGKYRILCQIQDQELLILIISIDKRDKVYR